MCRNAKIPSKAKLEKLLQGIEVPEYAECENANSFDHPDIPIITNREPGKVTIAAWGLIPEYINDQEKAKQMANVLRNARAETIFEKPSFAPYIQHKRCLIFLEGFYEWQHTDKHGKLNPKGKVKQQYYIDVKGQQIFAAGGIWTQWGDIKTCCVITTAANELMAEIHNDGERQPLILGRTQWQQWLDNTLSKDQIIQMMQVYPDSNMQAKKVQDEPEKTGGEQNMLF